MQEALGSCLKDGTAAALVHGGLSAEEAAVAFGHLDGCAACHALVAGVARTERAGDGAPLRRGDTVGRYLIVDVLGGGSMGVVYAAVDPDLGRRVALKVMRADAARAAGVGDAVLLREAQAMARLSHPNVVTVHDVGAQRGEVFIAMELALGGSLREWLGGAPAGWRTVARIFLQAAQGLAAAHRAGLVHRDFKPDNVLVTAEGIAKVGDFGLARVHALPETGAGLPSPGAPAGESLYRTGVLIGTPAYMSPEQRAGRPADARSDQYAFAVALHEALTGARPGEPALRLRRVPKALLSVAARGRAPEPERRYEDMDAVARALRRVLERRRRALTVFAGSLAAAAIAVPLLVATSFGETCSGARAAWGDAWDEPARAAVRRAFLATGASAATPLAFAERSLDAYGEAWVAMHADACRATRVRAEQSEALLDLRMVCLTRRRDEIAALVSILRQADARLTAQIHTALAAVPPLADCANAEALRAPVPLPNDPALRARVHAIERELARAHALLWTGRHEAGLETARAAVLRARATPHLPALAQALQLCGELERVRGLPTAEKTDHEAARTALQAHDLATAGRAWTDLVNVVGYAGHRREEAEVWAGYAEAAFRLIGDERRLATAELARGVALVETGELVRAVEIATRWRRFVESAFGIEHPMHYLPEWLLGAVAFEEGRFEAVAEIFHRVTVAQAPFNPQRANVARKNEAEALVRIPARREEGIALFRAALAEPGDLSDHSWARTRLADGLRRAGRADEALAEDRRALTGAERSGGRDSPGTALALTGIGADLLDLGRSREAVAPLERALSVRERVRTPIPLAETRWTLARALRAAGGAPQRARALAVEARAGLLPRARRYGAWYEETVRAIDAWLRQARPAAVGSAR